MARIKIYSDILSNTIFFDGAKTVKNKILGGVKAEAKSDESTRIVVSSTDEFKRDSDTVFKVLFKRLNYTRVENEAGEQLSAAPYNYTRDEVVTYLNEQFNKPKVMEYFEYNSTTDRLKAKKAIEVDKDGFYLGGKHKMASGNSNIYFEDLDTGINSYPVFGEVLDQSLTENQQAGEGTTPPKTRIFGDFQSTPLGGSPVNDTAITYDGDNFFPFNISGVGITTRIAEEVPPTQQLKYEIVVNGISVYVQYLEHNGLSVNEDLTWYFNQPLDIESGTTLRASIYKISIVGNQEVNEGLLLVCEGDDINTRYQTNVLNRLFTDEDIALKSDVSSLLTGATYKGTYDAVTPLPILPTGTDVLGDFYRVATPSGSYNIGDILVYNGGTAGDITDYDHIAEESVTQNDILTSGLKVHDVYVKAGYTGTVSDGSILYPYGDVVTALSAVNDGDSIYLDGVFDVTSQITLPADKSLFFYGSDGACIQYASYDATNGSIFRFTGTDNSVEYKFKNIEFKNAGAYALYIQKTAKVTIDDCVFKHNGWNGSALNTVLPEATTTLLGYDSTNTDLQAFYAGTNASNGGAMRIEEATQLLIVGNTVTNNLRGIRVSDCGVGGAGVISRNQSTQNIESGIYLSVGALGGCQNVTVMMNVSSYNANNGLLVIGGMNNKFSQNEVNGNWNAGFCAWGSANATLRDCGLYDNNRSQYNGIGNTGDAKASIQINEAYNLLGTSITLNPAFRFIAEILDTQVHYTGLGSNTEKIGFLITSAVGALADNAKNIIKVDDVGFIGQDYAIDLSEVDVSNLRLSLGDNSFQSTRIKAVKPPISGNYNELPFSNHVMEVPEVDVVVDTLKHMVTLTEGVGGNTINTYQANELSSILHNERVDIIQANTDKIQLRDLSFGNIYINGVIAGNSLNTANDSLNAAFNMDLIEYKEFLVSEVGINGDESSGGSLPAIANNWYISYGSQAGTQITTATIGNNYRAYNPFYNGEALEKGHEFIWTHNPTNSYMIGLWGAAEVPQAGDAAMSPSNWSQGFKFDMTNIRFVQADSSGVTIQQNGSIANNYDIPNGQLAIRFGQDNYLYLFEVVGGGYTLIGKSNSTIAGASVMIQWASFNEGSFPVMTERTETWEIVHDFDSSQNGEWSNGLEESTIIKSRVSVNPGEKLTLDFNYFGRSEKIGFGYTGAATGVANAEDTIIDGFFYNTSEVIKEIGASESNWTWNTSAANSYDPNGDRSDIGYDGRMNSSNNLGEISFRYNSDNSLEMWHETNNELIATKKVNLDGSAFNIYIGAAENNHTADRIPTLTKFDMSAEEEGASLTGWYYVESPDGEFYYPLFVTEAEANYIDSVEGGSGTSHTHTFADQTSGVTTWYMPDTNGVHAGTSSPQGGVFGNSINVVWNEIETNADSGYLPTFNSITYNVQEGSAINIQYKAAGMTDTFNITNVPAGYADDGFAIIGTAEDITNGYGSAVTHTINVTKANNFGSVQGTITINVLANLAGNEFTIVDQGGVIKFTQDGGITTLDFNTVTFNAGSTYKFYVDGATMDTNDIFDVVDVDGNSVTGNDGLSMTGGSGPGYAGTYFQYVIPTDVEPGKSLKFTDGDTNVVTTVPMTIAGSSYSVSITGITLEGPAANQTGTNIFEAADQHGWLSVDEPLGAGQRLVLTGAFLADAAEALGVGTHLNIGLKDGAWVNTIANDNPNGFEGGMGIFMYRSNTTAYAMYIANQDAGTNTQILGSFTAASQFLPYNAFIEVTSDGNNIRMGYDLTSTHDATTETYDDWNSIRKQESGDQGFGITELDVMVLGWPIAGRFVDDTTDADDIDWTALSEIAIPVASTANSTSWTKAVDFDGSNDYLIQGSTTSFSAIPMMLPIDRQINADSILTEGYTSSNGQARTWASTVTFKWGGGSSDQYIWSMGGSQSQDIHLYVNSGGDIYFAWGAGSPNAAEKLIGQVSIGEWVSVYVGCAGLRPFPNTDANQTNLNKNFDFRVANANFIANDLDASQLITPPATWASTGAIMYAELDGYFTVGASHNGNRFHGTIASMVTTTLKLNEQMPQDAEIKMMMLDPMGWLNDYKIGNTYRRPHAGGNYSNFQLNDNSAYAGTQVWLMGDGTNDNFSNGIRNQVEPTETTYTKLVFNNMVSSDIQNVSITGLS